MAVDSVIYFIWLTFCFSASQTLHFFNTPPNIAENEMRDVFTDAKSPRPKAIKFFQSKSKLFLRSTLVETVCTRLVLRRKARKYNYIKLLYTVSTKYCHPFILFFIAVINIKK